MEDLNAVTRSFVEQLSVRTAVYTSHVTRHTSHLTRHTSHVTPHTSHITQFMENGYEYVVEPPIVNECNGYCSRRCRCMILLLMMMMMMISMIIIIGMLLLNACRLDDESIALNESALGNEVSDNSCLFCMCVTFVACVTCVTCDISASAWRLHCEATSRNDEVQYFSMLRSWCGGDHDDGDILQPS
jgi:hypothetical protein